MDIIEMIKNDHKQIGAILDRLCDTTEAAVKTREELFPKLSELLLTHSKAEEKALYQTIENEEKTHDLVLESFEEHSLIENLLTDMAAMDVSDEHWTAKLSVLKENVEHHVDEEESELLPMVKKMYTAEELEEMADEFEQYKEDIGLEVEDIINRRPDEISPRA